MIKEIYSKDKKEIRELTEDEILDLKDVDAEVRKEYHKKLKATTIEERLIRLEKMNGLVE
jgi:hypothetical protein